MAIPRFQPIIRDLAAGSVGARNELGLVPADQINWVYRPDPQYVANAQASAQSLGNRGLILGGVNSYNPRNDMANYFHPTTGVSRSAYETNAMQQARDAIENERNRLLAVRDFMASPAGLAFRVQNQYDLFRGNQLNPDYYNAPFGDTYKQSFQYGFNAPTINDPYHGKAYQDALTAYYSQFAPVNYSNLNIYAPELFGGNGRVNYQVGSNAFTQQQLDSVKDNPELYNFATQWNEQIRKAADWTATLVNPYSPFIGSRVEGYQAPVLHETERYGVKFGGNRGAQAIGNTNDNPIPDTPGAGLWVYGIDPGNPDQIARAWENIFLKSSDEGARQALAGFAPRQNPEGSWQKFSTTEDLYNFAGALDGYYRNLAQRIDLPKSGILDSVAGQLITGLLTSAFTGGLGSIVGGLSGNVALGNIASAAASAGLGGLTGGVQGAITGGLGSAIGSGIDFAGGVGDFISNPLDALGGAFDIGAGAAGGAAGGLLGMADAAQVGPGSLASNTPPVTGPIADEIVTVTASAPGSTGNYGWLASTLAARGIPAGAQLVTDDRGYLTGYSLPPIGDTPMTLGILSDATGRGAIPPDFINGAPSNTAVGGPGAGGPADAGGVAGGQTQGGAGASTGGAIGGAVTDILGGGTGTSVIGSGTTGTGLAGGTTDLTGVGGSGTTGAGTGGAGTGPGTGATGSGGVSGTGGTGAGTGGLLDTGVTPGTGGTTGPTESLTPEQQAIRDIGLSAGFSTEAIDRMIRDLAASGGSVDFSNIGPTNSWAGQVSGPIPNFVTQQPLAPVFGSPEWVQQQIDNAMANPSPMVGMPSPGNTWAGQLTGEPVNFVSDTGTGTGAGTGAGTGTSTGIGTGTGAGTGTGTSTGAGTGNQGGLTDAELAALLTAGAVGTGIALGGGQDGLGTTAGTSTGFNSTVGPGTGPGTDTGIGPGTGGGTGSGTGTGTGDGTGLNPGLDLLMPQLQGLLQTGFQPGTGAEFPTFDPVGSILGGVKTNFPKTPQRKKRGIRVNISGRARNA